MLDETSAKFYVPRKNVDLPFSPGVGNLWPAGRIRPTAGFHPAHLCLPKLRYITLNSLCEYRFPLKILMKINESLAKINTAVFYILSAPEYNYHDFDRKKAKMKTKWK